MNDGWFREDDRILSDINVTPLVDVALVLLIVFMITAPMMIQGADVQLPRTRPMDSLPQDQLMITLTADGQTRLNGEAIPPEELEVRLSPRLSPGRLVLLYGDERIDYGRVMRAVAIVHSLGGEIGMVTEPIPER